MTGCGLFRCVLQLKRRRQSGRSVRGERRETNFTMAVTVSLFGESKHEQVRKRNGMIFSLKKIYAREICCTKRFLWDREELKPLLRKDNKGQATQK
jgi:hypothetical protein